MSLSELTPQIVLVASGEDRSSSELGQATGCSGSSPVGWAKSSGALTPPVGRAGADVVGSVEQDFRTKCLHVVQADARVAQSSAAISHRMEPSRKTVCHIACDKKKKLKDSCVEF